MSKTQAIPVGDRILVLPDQKVTEEFGLIIPEQAQKAAQTGKVVGVGPGSKGDMQISTGDHILYSDYAGTEIELNGIKYRIMREPDVYCILKLS
jgi:chaperonin GroES